MRLIRKYFISGSLIVFPVLITIFLFLWSFKLLDSFLGRYVDDFLISNYGYTFPGSGIILAIVLILLVGFSASHLISKKVLSFFEEFFFKFPLIKQVYPSVKQMVSFIFSDRRISFRKVVLIEYPRKEIYSLGFITNESSELFREKTRRRDLVNVFIPTTPNPLTGYFVLAPQSEIITIDISVEEALKMLISGGVVNPSQNNGETLPF